MERDGLLAVYERGTKALDGDIGGRAVREVRWFGGDQIWVGSMDAVRRSVPLRRHGHF